MDIMSLLDEPLVILSLIVLFFWASIDALILRRKPISAIEEYRAQTRAGLKEAKLAVERCRDRLSFE